MIGVDDEMVELKGRCVPLLFDCPVRTISRDCPFVDIREWEVVARVNWLKVKSEKELRAMLSQHAQCMEGRG